MNLSNPFPIFHFPSCFQINLEKCCNDGECRIDKDTSLSNHKQEVVKLEGVTGVLLQLPHLAHGNDDGSTGQAVHDQLGECCNLLKTSLIQRFNINSYEKKLHLLFYYIHLHLYILV